MSNPQVVRPKPVPQFFLDLQSPQEKLVKSILEELGESFLPIAGRELDLTRTYAFFIWNGRFRRIRRRTDQDTRQALLHIGDGLEDFEGMRASDIPELARGSKGYVAMRKLTDQELTDPEVKVRLTNALREVRQICIKRVRQGAQSKSESADESPNDGSALAA